MKKKIFGFLFIFAAVFVINDICSATAQMKNITIDLPILKGVYTTGKVAKNEFTNQKYWNNQTYNTKDSSKKYDLLVELIDTETNSTGFKTISNGSTRVYNYDWEKYAGRTYYLNIKSGTSTFNKTFTTGIWYISY